MAQVVDASCQDDRCLLQRKIVPKLLMDLLREHLYQEERRPLYHEGVHSIDACVARQRCDSQDYDDPFPSPTHRFFSYLDELARNSAFRLVRCSYP